jgi:hypothetical protein
MRVSKTKLKQIIKEELQVVLTNEEVEEMFGEEVREQVEAMEEGEIEEAFEIDVDKYKGAPTPGVISPRTTSEQEGLDRFLTSVEKRIKKDPTLIDKITNLLKLKE